MIIDGKKAEDNGLKKAAELLCVAARTAPKAKGKDNLVTCIITGEEKEKLAEEMNKIAEEKGVSFFKRDADNVNQSPVVILLGTKIGPVGVPNCGYCGYHDCSENKEHGGICVYNTGDLGIAVGSCVSKASDLRIDNRVLFSAGKAAVKLGLLGDDVKIAYGIPLSSTGKSIYFDRK